MTDSEQVKYNVAIIREGLNAIASPSDKQLALNKKGLVYLDDVFDPMPLDYLPWLIEMGKVSESFGGQVKDLYQLIDDKIGFLEWKEEDDFLASNGKDLRNWRKVAEVLLRELNGL